MGKIFKGLRVRINMLLAFILTLAIRINRDQYIFISMGGRCKGGNPQAIFNYIHNVEPNAKLAWACEKCIKSDSRNELLMGSFSYYFYLFSSKYIIADSRLSFFILPHKRKNQIYIQTWHGTALKRIEAAAVTLPIEYVRNAQRDSRMIDIFISGSAYMSKIYQSDFWFNNKLLEIGTPRNDIFFSDIKEQIIEKVHRVLGISKNQKILLFAPTFRNDKDSVSEYEFNENLLLKSVSQKFGEDFVLVTRLHPHLIKDNVSIDRIKNSFPKSIDASFYPDIQELLVASDILITDYSSCMFDFIYTNKPCFIYARDISSYDRGFYMDIFKLPFAVAQSESELWNIISEFDDESYLSRIKKFLVEIEDYESGNACEQLFNVMRNYV